MAVMGDHTKAAVLTPAATISKLISRRRANKASAMIPNVAIRAVRELLRMLEFLTALCDLIFATGEVGHMLCVIWLNHKFKGKLNNPDLIASYRPLGQADPIMYLVGDLWQLRTGFCVAQFVGPSQLGGKSDSRFHVVTQRDCRTVRQRLRLPVLECSVDARFGFDGGRHAQVLLQAHNMGMSSIDWLVLESLLSRYTMRVKAKNVLGLTVLLEPVKPLGGGMVQGLPSSTSVYSLLLQHLSHMLSTNQPGLAMSVEPEVLQAYRRLSDGHLSVARGLSWERVAQLGTQLLRTIDKGRLHGWQVEEVE